MAPRVAVLALQGGVEPHLASLARIGVAARAVRDARELLDSDALVWPGGESTAQQKLIARFGLGAVLDAFVASGRPLLATCAGLILCARRGYLDARVERNAYGRQLESFCELTDDGHRLSFIRAPRLLGVGPDVEVLARLRGEPVVVRQRALIATTGHPELTGDDWLHRALISLIAA